MGRLSVLVLALCVVVAHASDSLRGNNANGDDVAALKAQLAQEENKIQDLQAQNAKDRGTFLNFIKKASNIMGQDNKIFAGVDQKTGNIKQDLQEAAPANPKEAAAAVATSASAAASASASAAASAAASASGSSAAAGSGSAPEVAAAPVVTASPAVDPPKDEAVDDKEVEDIPKKQLFATRQTYPGTGNMAGSNEKETVFRYAAPPPGGAPPSHTTMELQDPTTVKKVEEADHDKYNLFEALPSPDEPIEPVIETISHDIPKPSEGYSLNPPPPGPQSFPEPAPAPQVDVIHEMAGEGVGTNPPMGEIPSAQQQLSGVAEDIAAVAGNPQL